MIAGAFMKVLRGKHGWSFLNPETVDVEMIHGVCYRKRLFMVFDRDRPYTLVLGHYLPEWITGVSRSAFMRTGVLSYSITRRFKSEDEVRAEIAEIMRIKDAIKYRKYRRDVMKGLKHPSRRG